MATPATLWPLPFSLPFSRGKGSAPRGRFLWGATPPLVQRTFQKRVAAPCSYLGPAGGPTALPTGSATRIITYSRRFPIGGGGRPAAQHGSRHAIRTPRAGCAPNQTSNQTSARGLVSWPRLPRFGHFPFHFPFRGEKGSAPCGRSLWDAPPLSPPVGKRLLYVMIRVAEPVGSVVGPPAGPK